MVCYVTGPSSRVGARAPCVQHLLRGGYNVAYPRFKEGKDIMHALVHPRKNGGGGEVGATSGKPVLETSF